MNRIVTMWLDYAEDQAKRKNPVYMKDWREKLDRFSTFNERAILEHAGKINMDRARELALEQYQAYNAHRIESRDRDAEEEFEIVVHEFESGKKNKVINLNLHRHGGQPVAGKCPTRDIHEIWMNFNPR